MSRLARSTTMFNGSAVKRVCLPRVGPVSWKSLSCSTLSTPWMILYVCSRVAEPELPFLSRSQSRHEVAAPAPGSLRLFRLHTAYSAQYD